MESLINNVNNERDMGFVNFLCRGPMSVVVNVFVREARS
jgi:hypothetical protein